MAHLTALVLGGAACLHADLARVGQVDVRVAVNDAGYTFADLNAVATVHHEKVPGWRARRAAAGFPDTVWISFDGMEHGIELWRPADLDRWVWGSSGLYAVGVALHVFGADLVILAGCPMDATPNLYRDEVGWAQYQRFRIRWEKLAPYLRGRVYSMGGWTAELLNTGGT